MISKELKELCNEWIKFHGMDMENFDITEKEIKEEYNKITFVFLYNKAFASAFIQPKSTISEMQNASDFCFQIDFGDSITVQRDVRGKLVGRHGRASRIIEELKLGLENPEENSKNTIANWPWGE